jgi:hypothetical protein
VTHVTRCGRDPHSWRPAALSILASSRRETSPGRNPKELAVNNFFDQIADAMASVTSYDDIATAVAGVAFCVVSVSMFAVVFAGAM